MGFGDNLKKARLERGMTQVEIANQLGIDKSTYSGYESGKRQPDVKRIKELASLLRVSADELIGSHYSTHVDSRFLQTPAESFAAAINNRSEVQELLRLAVDSSTDDVWRIIEIWRLVQQPMKKK